MKFIHIADVHFDMPFIAFAGKKDFAKKRRSEQKKAFHDVIQFAKKEKIDCLFISGDLFEQKYVEPATIDYIISNFQLIPEVSIFISPGNHDPFLKNSPYEVINWPDNVTIFKNDYGLISLEEVDIYGVGFEDYKMTESQISKIEIENKDKINILVTHGTLNGAMHQYQDIKENDLKKFDYVALGHIHDRKVDESRIIYPGSLISCGFDEPDEHGFIYGEITKEECNVEFKPLNYKKFEKIVLDITNYRNFSEALEKLDLKEDYYEIKLVGTRNFDIIELIESIKEKSEFICKIKDNTRPAYDFDAIKKEENLKGLFTKKMLDEIDNMNENEKQEAFRLVDMIYQMMNG